MTDMLWFLPCAAQESVAELEIPVPVKHDGGPPRYGDTCLTYVGLIGPR